MKKLSFVFAAIAAVIMASCGQGTPKADLKNDLDTLSYAIGVSQSEGLTQYLQAQLNIDSTYMDEFIKGLNEGANAGDDKKKAAYFAGIQIGQQISQQMVKGINHEIFGEDTTKTISVKNLLAGFIGGATSKGNLMTYEQARQIAQTKMEDLKKQEMERQFGPWKKENEAFMAKIAKSGAKKLDGGVYYEVITEGTGEIPTDTTQVTVDYEGRLINDTIFDSSYQRGEPIVLRCNQVIPGWTAALTHMPVGSKWKVYIPQDKAYGEREAGKVKPYSTLVFTIELKAIGAQ